MSEMQVLDESDPLVEAAGVFLTAATAHIERTITGMTVEPSEVLRNIVMVASLTVSSLAGHRAVKAGLDQSDAESEVDIGLLSATAQHVAQTSCCAQHAKLAFMALFPYGLEQTGDTADKIAEAQEAAGQVRH